MAEKAEARIHRHGWKEGSYTGIEKHMAGIINVDTITILEHKEVGGKRECCSKGSAGEKFLAMILVQRQPENQNICYPGIFSIIRGTLRLQIFGPEYSTLKCSQFMVHGVLEHFHKTLVFIYRNSINARCDNQHLHSILPPCTSSWSDISENNK